MKKAEIAEKLELDQDDIRKINNVFDSVVQRVRKRKRYRWLNSDSTNKWDILAALFMAAGVAAATFGIAWASSYLIMSLSGTQIAASVGTLVMSEIEDPVKLSQKLQTFIMKYMPWIIIRDPMLTVKQLHRKTKKNLIKHFGSVEEFDSFMNSELS